MRGSISWRAVLVLSVAMAIFGLSAGPAGAATLTWDKTPGTAGAEDGAGVWLDPNQWWDGAANQDWVSGSDAIIGSGGAGGTITLGIVTAGSVLLDNFTGTYTLSGTSLDQSGGITVGATAGNVTINSPVSGTGGITMAGAGRLTLSSTSSSYSGQLSIEDGELYATSINNNGANGVLGNSALPVIMGASGQTGRLSILKDGGISSNKDFTLATDGTGEIRFGNLGNFSMTNADRPLTLSGTIGGAGNFVKLGGAAVILSGNNNYSGTTTVSEGPLRLKSANAIPGGIGATGGTSALTINGGVVELTSAGGDFLRGLGTGIHQFQIPGGISGFSANGSARQVIVNNDPSFELPWGDATFNPSKLLLNYQTTGNNKLTLQNKIDLAGATRTIEVRNNTAELSGDIRTSIGTAGLTKTGNGTLVLSGNNTYNGPTTISTGTLTIGNAGAFTNTSQIVLSGTSRLEVTAANASLAKLVAGGGVPFGTFLRYSSQAQAAAGAANGPGTIGGTVEINLTNVNPDYTLDFGSNSKFQNLVDATYTSPITLSGDASITSITNPRVFTLSSGGITASTSGAKTLTLNAGYNVANTISSVIGNGSGTIAVAKSGNGSWTLTGANTYSGETTVSAGTLTLSGADGAIGSSAVTMAGGTLTLSNTDAANNGDRLSDSLAFTMNGGTFNFNNDASANNFSESAGTLTLAGGSNTVGIQQAASGQTSTLTFAGLSRTAGALNFSGAGLGTAVDTRGQITFTSAPALTNGIIGPWATVNGTDYATLSGNDVVAYGGPMTDLTRQSSGAKVIPDDLTADVRIIEGTGGSPANLTLAGATTTTIRSLLQSISGGTSAATVDIDSGKTLLVDSINSVPTGSTLTLTLGTAVNTGTLMPATAGGNLLLINSSTAANSANANNNMTINSVVADNTSASTVTKDGGGVLRLTGTNTYSGGTVINAGTLAVKDNANLGATGTGITFNGSAALSFGKHPATGSLTVDLGTRPIAINNSAVVGLYHNWADTTITIGGAVTGTGGLNWGRDPVLTYNGGSGSVKLNLNSTGNNFTGPITVGMGNENAQGGKSAFTFSSLADSTNPITFNFNGGAVKFVYGATATQDLTLNNRSIVLAANGNNTSFQNLSSYNLSYNAPLLTSGTGNRTLKLSTSSGTGTATFGGVIADGPGGVVSVDKSGGGTWRLGGTNTYTGQTKINDGGGTLAFQNASQSMSAASKLWIGGSAGMTLLDDGTGTINLGNNVDVGVAGTGERDGPTIFVGNNNTANGGYSSGTTTGSTIALGTFDLTYGDSRSSQILRIRGNDGYRLQIAGLTLAKRADNSHPQIEPTTAPITIAGTVMQVSGKLATDSTNSDTLDLIGSATGNLISGNIMDAADYTDLSNPNAKPLNILKSGTSTWTLSGNNTYSGVTTLSGGTLAIGASNNLGSGGATNTLVFNGGTLQITGTALTQMSDLTSGGRGITFNGGKLVGLDIADAGHTFTVDQVLDQTNGGFTKSGPGTVVLNQINTYTGNTTVSEGKLLLGQGGVMAATAVSVTGTATLGTSYTSSGTTIDAGKSLGLADGTSLDLQDGYTNTLSFTTTGAFSGAGLYFDLGATTADQVELLGAATVTNTNTFYFDALASLATGDHAYTLITAASGLTGGTFDIGTTLPGYTLALDPTATAIYLNVTLDVVQGDTNGDKVVDAADFITLKKNFGGGVGGGAAAGNFDEIGTVNWADLNILTSNIGSGSGAPGTAPEPATLFVMMAAGLPALLKRRRRRS